MSAVETGAELVAGVDLALARGKVLGIVGESGSGKTALAMALLGFARPGTRISAGSVRIGDADVLAMGADDRRLWWGRAIGFVPQNPTRALSPGMRVGRQIAETVEVRHPPGPERAEMLRSAWARAQLPMDVGVLRRYPHQLSGGQNQRVSIAMALALDPSVLILDEPTTGLDVVTQARLLEVIRALRKEQSSSIIYVSHDLGVVRNLADRVAVMYAGHIVEAAAVRDLFQRPAHPYTRGLLEAIPRLDGATVAPRGISGHAEAARQPHAGCPFAPRCGFKRSRCETEMPPPEVIGPDGHTVRCWHWAEITRVRPLHAPAGGGATAPAERAAAAPPLVSVKDLVAGHRQRRSLFGGVVETVAVKGASFDILKGSCLAIVGESGSGKTTLGRCLAGLHEPTAGEMLFAGAPLPASPRLRDPSVRRRIQIVFQDPDSSLNPSMTVARSLRRPLRQFFRLGRAGEQQRIAALLRQVGLAPELGQRLPSELSGGQKQRVAIARALAAEPDLLICDEVTSALDVLVQASIVALLADLRRSTGMAMLFISHELGVVRAVSDYVAIMYQGRLIEAGETAAVFAAPRQGYTRSLLAAAPELAAGDYPFHVEATQAGASR